MRARTPLAVAILASAASLSGCGADPYPGQPDEGTVHIAFTTEMGGFDPARASEEIRTYCVLNTYDALYEYHYLKRPYELQPCLAERAPEISPDGLLWRIRLKAGVRYVDDPCFPRGKGREVVASDFVYDVLRLMDAHTQSPGAWVLGGYVVGLDDFATKSAEVEKDPARAAYRAEEGYPGVAGLSAVDERTIQIRLVKPYPQLEWVLAMPYLSVYPPEAVARYGAEFLNHAVGSGPYRVVEYNPSQRLVLERREGYRDDRYPSEGAPGDRERGLLDLAGKPLPQNERVVCLVMKEAQPRWLYFECGYLDRVAIPKDNYDSAIDPAIQDVNARMRARGVRLHKEPGMEVFYDGFNMLDPVVGKGPKAKAIRCALSLATDFAWAAEHLDNGRVEDMQGVIPRDLPEWDPTYRNPWKPLPGETREHALSRARKILADAGMPGGEGIPAITVDVLDNATSGEFFLAMQRDARDVGIPLKQRNTTWQEQIEHSQQGEFQVFNDFGWVADYPDAQNFMQLLYGPNRPPNANSSSYANPEYDALYEKALPMAPSPERTEIYRRMERIAMEDCPWIVRNRHVNYYLAQPWLEGYRPHDVSGKTWKYARVDAARRRHDLRSLNEGRPAAPILATIAFGLLVVVTVLRSGASRRGW